MAMIYPKELEPTRSAAERKIFLALQKLQSEKQWYIIHSLKIFKRNDGANPFETDFVVIIPNKGIVCFEVKGGGVSREQGNWYSVDRSGEKHKIQEDPVNKSRSDMHTLMDYLWSKKIKGFEEICFAHAAILPDIKREKFEDPGIHAEQIVFGDDLGSDLGNINSAFLSVIDSQRNEYKKLIDEKRPSSEGFKESLARRKADIVLNSAEPELNTISKIIELLCPDLKFVPIRAYENAEKVLEEMTEEQFTTYRSARNNPRLWVEGPAGTGKTIIAKEQAKLEIEEGRKVALLCFNKLIGRLSLKEVSECKYVGSIHEVLTNAIMQSELAEEYNNATTLLKSNLSDPKIANDFYNNIFPETARRYFESDPERRVDTLIIDEAQDLLIPKFDKLFDTMVKGGREKGRWFFFGDYSRQEVYKHKIDNAFLDTWKSFASIHNLDKNCRNTLNIGKAIAKITEFSEMGYCPNQIEGPAVEIIKYDDSNKFAQLFNTLKKLVDNDRVPLERIVILSRYRLENSSAEKLAQYSNNRWEAIDMRDESVEYKVNQVRFSTIQAFKGMEATAIILCDIDKNIDDETRNFLYVGMSRARTHLVLLWHNWVELPKSK